MREVGGPTAVLPAEVTQRLNGDVDADLVAVLEAVGNLRWRQ
jgi:hypothetical protein